MTFSETCSKSQFTVIVLNPVSLAETYRPWIKSLNFSSSHELFMRFSDQLFHTFMEEI